MHDRVRVGEKAAYLGELIQTGFDVPPGFCITADAYREVLATSHIDEKIETLLQSTEIEDPLDLEHAADEIRVWIENAAAPPALLQQILEA